MADWETRLTGPQIPTFHALSHLVMNAINTGHVHSLKQMATFTLISSATISYPDPEKVANVFHLVMCLVFCKSYHISRPKMQEFPHNNLPGIPNV